MRTATAVSKATKDNVAAVMSLRALGAIAKEKVTAARVTAVEKGEDPDAVAIPILAVDSRIRAKFNALCEESRSLKQSVDELESQRSEITAKIAAIADANGLNAVDGDSYLFRRKFSGDRKSVNADKLIDLGVPFATVQAATVVTKGKTSYVVSGRKTTG
jgi:hypothetical protein